MNRSIRAARLVSLANNQCLETNKNKKLSASDSSFSVIDDEDKDIDYKPFSSSNDQGIKRLV